MAAAALKNATIAHINKPSTQAVLSKLRDELKKWNGELSFIENLDNTLNITFNVGGWNETWQASFDHDEVWFRIRCGEEWKLKWDADRSFQDNQELLDIIRNYFVYW
jgi:hypothetical protein